MGGFKEISDLDAVYVPIGLGSGVCGDSSSRFTGFEDRNCGVVAENAPAYSLSLEAED